MKKSLIIGFGATGASVADFLHSRDQQFDIVDAVPCKLAENRFKHTQVEMFSQDASNLDLTKYHQLFVSPGIPDSHPLVQKAKHLRIPCSSDIELFSEQIPNTIIIITGSNGKSTVTKWLETILNQCHHSAIAVGNIGVPVLAALLQQEREKHKYSHWIIEASSFQIEKFCTLPSESAVVLNVSHDHLDRHVTLQRYASIKQQVLSYSLNPIINREDTLSFPKHLKHLPSFGLDSPTREQDFGVIGSSLYRGNTKLCERQDIRLPGRHNTLNALAVWMLAQQCGLTDGQIRSSIVNWNGLPHRFQIILKHNKITWINDSKSTNFDALSSAISSCAFLQHPLKTSNRSDNQEKKVIAIIGGQSKTHVNHTLALLIQSHVKTVLLFGRDAQNIEKQLIELGCTVTLERHDSLDSVVCQCGRIAQAYDYVLFSPGCASFDMFKNFEHRGEQFIALVKSTSKKHVK